MAKAKKKYVGSVKRAKRQRDASDPVFCTMCDCTLSGTKEDTYFVPIAKTPICFNCSDLTTSAIRGVTSLFARR